MSQKSFWSSLAKRAFMLVCIPIVLTSTGYALFSQQLSIAANTSKPAYTRSQNLSITYTRGVAVSGSNRTYTIAVTIKNDGTRAVSAWQSEFSLPSDFSAISCTNATCTRSGTTNVAVNTGANGTIDAGASTNYSFTFTSANQNYLFTALTVSGTPAFTYTSVAGLTESHTAGTRTKQGNTFSWPYTFTVANNSGQNLDGWRLQCPWSTTNTVSAMSATVSFTTTASQLTILSKQPISTATTFQFTGTITSNNQNYTLTGCTIQGQF